MVLSIAGRPLRPAEMLEEAWIRKLMPRHLFGLTQHKTLHARLSEDIVRLGENSRFCRTAPGTFFLRSSWHCKPKYVARRRKLDLNKTPILFVRTESWSNFVKNLNCSNPESVKRLLKSGEFRYISSANKFRFEQYKPISCLIYISSQHGPLYDKEVAKKSLVLTTSIRFDDYNLFSQHYWGVLGACCRRCRQSLANRLSDALTLEPDDFKLCGLTEFLNRDGEMSPAIITRLVRDMRDAG